MLRFQNDASLTVKDINKDIDLLKWFSASSVVSKHYIFLHDNSFAFRHALWFPEAFLVTFYAIWNNWILVYKNTTRTITVCIQKPWRGTHVWGWHAWQDKQRLGWSRLKGCIWFGFFRSKINRTRKKIGHSHILMIEILIKRYRL